MGCLGLLLKSFQYKEQEVLIAEENDPQIRRSSNLFNII